MPDALTLRPIDAEEVLAFARVGSLAYHIAAGAERWVRLMELERSCAAFDGDELVGTSGAHTQRLSIPGGELPCAGVTFVAVLPTHRRRGILTRMIDALLAQARERGEPLAALSASEGGIYGRFGFGPAVWHAHYEISTHEQGAPHPARPGAAALRLELRELDGAEALLAPVWERMRERRAGIPTRTERWWRGNVLADPPDERHGATPKRLVLACAEDGTPRGYAIYRSRGEFPATVETCELIVPDDDAAAALWRFLLSIDLVTTVAAPERPLDDALRFLFPDVRRARVVKEKDFLWLRLLDVRSALERRAWACETRVTLALRDERIPANDGTWILETSAEGASCVSARGREPDLALDVRELGTAYLGGITLTRLLAAGHVEERTPGAAARLDAALRVPLAPWSPELF